MRRLMLFALPFAAGTALCQYLLPERLWAWSAGGFLLAGLALSFLLRGRRQLAVRIAAVGLSAGILWFSGYAALYLAPAEALAGTTDTVTLELLDFPEEAAHGARCLVKVEGLRGRAVYYGDYSLLELEPGDRVTTEAKFYSAAVLAGERRTGYTASGVFARLYGKGEAVVERSGGGLRYLPQRMARSLKLAVSDLFPQPEAGFLTAMLTGDDALLDAQSASDLNESGLSHVTAVSGLHCGFLVGLLGVLVLRRQRLTLLLGYPVLIGYVLMTGCSPSSVRACVMAGFFLLAPLLGREGDAATSLSGALLLLLIADPFSIASVSLQLSFAALAGLMLPAPMIYDAIDRRRPRMGRVLGALWEFAVGTVAASLGVMAATAPLTALYFRTLPLVSPLANLAVLWAAPVLFASALLISAGYLLWPGLAPLAVLPELLGRYVLGAAGVMAKLPGHCLHFNTGAEILWLLLAYTMVGLCLLSKDPPRKYALAALLAAVCLTAARALPGLSLGRLTVVAVDVGQGAATLLSSEGRTALVDCGTLGLSSGPGAAVANAMEAYGWEELSYVALTHYHEDHAGGLAELLSRVKVGAFLLPQLLENEDQAELQQEVLALAERYGVPVEYVREPEALELGGALLRVYPPLSEGDTNEEGLTVLCTAGEFDVLITGDMGSQTERRLVEQYALPDIEVLLAGHHGSKHSTSEELLEAVSPEVGIISVGVGNTFGHPTEEAMDRMRRAGMDLYRTDLEGNILIRVHDWE